MNLRTSLAGVAIGALVFVGGCATKLQPAVPMAASALSAPGTRIGVAMTPLPKVDTYLPGARCLLCLAAAAVANSSLTAYTRALPYEDLPALKETIAALIRKQGAEPFVIVEPIRLGDLPDHAVQGDKLARKDFSSLRKKYGVDKLLVIDISQLGFERTYSAYVPTSDPKGVMRGSGSLIDLKTNALEWYLPLVVRRSPDGSWDEPPKYPGLTNAYFQVLELGKDEVLKPFKP